MKARIKRWFSSRWAVPVVTTLFGALVTVVIDVLRKLPILNTFVTVATASWAFVIWLVNLDLKVWWVLLAILCMFGLVFLILKVLVKNSDLEPGFIKYTEDVFRGWKWSWMFELDNFAHTYQIENIQIHCQNCDTPVFVTSEFGSLRFDCPRCGLRAWDRLEDAERKTKALISDNVDRMIKVEKLAKNTKTNASGV